MRKMVHYGEMPVSWKETKKFYSERDTYNDKKQTTMGFCFRKFAQFSKRTDLHGFKYIVMEDLNVVERSCWAISVFVSVIVAIYFVVTAYNWYARNPIVTVIESTQGAIWDVPFPAVTICDLNIVSRKAAWSFANNLTLPDNVTVDFVFKAVRLAPLLHSTYPVNSSLKRDLYILQKVLDTNHIEMEALFRQLSPVSSCNQLLERCMWKNSPYRCDQLFQEIFTLQNICCSFNYYGAAVTNKKLLRGSGTPRRVASCGYQTALTVLIRIDPADYYSAFVASQGALVTVTKASEDVLVYYHSSQGRIPAESKDDAYNVPDLDSPVRLVNPSSEVMMALSPERTYSTPGVRSFTPDQRQCYYKDEIKIANFRRYSFHNCMIYQNMDIMKKVCDCVPFYYIQDTDVSRTCDFTDIECLESIQIMNETLGFLGNDSTFHCLPECEHFNYHFEIALGWLAKDVKLNGHPFFKDVELENRSLLNVFFNDLVSTKYRRDVYLNWQNILAAFGGLLSLMLGFTLISGFDMLLFFLFKVVYDGLRRYFAISVVDKKKGTKEFSKNNKHTKHAFYKNQWSDRSVKNKIRRW